MATQAYKTMNFLFLDQITLQVQDDSDLNYGLVLLIENQEVGLERKETRIWTSVQSRSVSPTSQVRIQIQKIHHPPWAKQEPTSKEIDLQQLFNDYWTSEAHQLTVNEVVVVGNHDCSVELRFSTNANPDSLRLLLHELEELLKEYSPLMDKTMEKVLDKVIQYGAAITKSKNIASALFSVARTVSESLKEQTKADQMPLALIERLSRVLPLADNVADDIVCEETEILDKIIPRMYETMQTAVKFACEYVKRGRFERTESGIISSNVKDMIAKMNKDLARIIEDFICAVDVEALCRVKRTEEELLLRRLKYVEAGYALDRCCMEGTRQYILDQIMAWVENPQEQNTYWLYGLPGVGKSSLAHSICENLHTQQRLAGAFFCRRDDPDLREPKNILQAFIYKLALIFPPFRTVVAERLRNDQDLTPNMMGDTLFLDFIRSLPCHPDHALVLVIDALDECGDTQSRTDLLKVLTDAAAQALWLKIIITSRPEGDIERFFDGLTQSSYCAYDLGKDKDANTDLRTFAQSQFDLVASEWYLSAPWPEESVFDRAISRADGLFTFIKTLVLVLQESNDPEESLNATLQDSDSAGLESLYELYSTTLQARIAPGDAEFQRVIGVLLATAPYRALCEETIGELAGVNPNLVKTWVGDLGSLVYRDNRGIRVQHASISDFFLSDHCDYQVNLGDTNALLSVVCLKTMVGQLCFNICKLGDSRLANANVEDLPSRIKQNISSLLQYSSLYWSNHLCLTPDTGDQRVWTGLKEFFEGLYPIFWIEVLSIMGMVPIAVPSLQRVMSWVKDADPPLLERIQDICHFITTFHTPISLSAPHIYISTQPFLLSQSPLSSTLRTNFIKGIQVQGGRLPSWPASPLELVEHINCMSPPPNGRHIVTGSDDTTLRIWDAETGAVDGGHTASVQSVVYSPDGREIISGPVDIAVRTWDAGTGVEVGKPLEGHTGPVRSVAHPSDGQHIISGSEDQTVRIWDAKTGTTVSKPLVHAGLYAQPDPDGWVKDSEGGLLYWVLPECRTGPHSPSLLPLAYHV